MESNFESIRTISARSIEYDSFHNVNEIRVGLSKK
jgi:hypothetical protein